jgi:hypothetical protein
LCCSLHPASVLLKGELKCQDYLDHAFKEKDVFTLTTLTGATSLTYFPDVILAPATMTGNCTVDLSPDAGDPQTFNRTIRVVNQDDTYTCSVGVNGGTDATPVGPGQSVDFYVANGTATTTPVSVSPNAVSGVRNFAAAASDYAMLADDGIETAFANDAITLTLPVAASNKGRRILFVQLAAAVLTIAQNADDANIDGADADYVALDAANDRAELVSTGTEWLVVSSTIA